MPEYFVIPTPTILDLSRNAAADMARNPRHDEHDDPVRYAWIRRAVAAEAERDRLRADLLAATLRIDALEDRLATARLSDVGDPENPWD